MELGNLIASPIPPGDRLELPVTGLPVPLFHQRSNVFGAEAVLHPSSQLPDNSSGGVRGEMSGLLPAHSVRNAVQQGSGIHVAGTRGVDSFY